MSHRLTARAAAVAGALALTVLLSPPAHAADEITIDHVESDNGTVSVLVGVDGIPGGAAPDLKSVQVTVDDEPVDATATTVKAGEIERTTVLALDASNSMRGPQFAAAKAAAHAFLDSAPDDVEIGLVTFSNTITEAVPPTTDHGRLAEAIDAIQLTNGTHLYDAVVQAVDTAGTDGARSVLVLSDGEDRGSKASLEQAAASAKDGGVVVDVVALDQGAAERAQLARIATGSGGKVIEAATPGALAAVFTAQADALANQVLVQFPQPDLDGTDASLAVSLKAGSTTFRDTAYVTLSEASAAGPKTVDPGSALLGQGGLMLGALALGLGLAGLLVVVLVGQRGPSKAQAAIAAYTGDAPARAKGSHASAAAQLNLKDSAVELTGKLVKGDFETRLAQKLAGAGSSLTAAEWLLLHAGIALGLAFVGVILRGGGLGFVLLVVGAVVPWVYLSRRHNKRLAAFNGQLAETLTLMSGGLSAGLSMPQAIDTVVKEGHEPMAGELRRALIEARLGVDIEDALDGVAQRMDSEDFAWVVMAIRIQREVGGNLAELLNTVADTLREREYLRRQVKVLSAEGRMSAWVLGLLPPAMFVYMLLFRPDFARVMYTTGAGLLLSAAAVGMLAVGVWVLTRLVKIEV